MIRLIDTHTHFDVPEYDGLRSTLATDAFDRGVQHLLLIGLLAKYFGRMVQVRDQLAQLKTAPMPHLAFGLHPLYVGQQHEDDLETLATFMASHSTVAIGEIGLDAYQDELKDAKVMVKQEMFFIEQIKLAKAHELPILLHIRKKHADVFRILKEQSYRADNLGGIAHGFSGGEQEALAFVKMGFKLGITGQITNLNAKKLRRAVMAVFKKYGAQAFVIETDCPDMIPACCHHHGRLNVPANLIHVFDELSLLFEMDQEVLARQLWQNTNAALRQEWIYE